MFSIRLNPITRKRFRRFREMRRAYWSFLLLLVMYLVSLGAELLCNSVPLYVRFQGRSYFPVFRFYPDDTFTGNGNFTRPDYKAIEALAAFQGGTGNFMIWPPVPYGPYEVLKPQDLLPNPNITVHLQPLPRVGSIRVSPGGAIERSQAAASFFDVTGEDEVNGLVLEKHYPLPEPLREAVRTRFENRPADRFEATVTSRSGIQTIEFSMARFQPRAKPPDLVKILLREKYENGSRGRRIVFIGNEVRKDCRAVWEALPVDVRDMIDSGVRRQAEGEDVEDMSVDLTGQMHTLSFERETVRFPFRPTARHWFGVDDAGRDVFARIFYGLRISLTFGLVLLACSFCIGTVIGSIQGYFGGTIDILGQRLIEIWSALPFLYVMILMGSVYGRSFALLIFCYGLFNWIGISYYMRAEMLRLRMQPFVEAAKCLGLPAWKIVFRHILPNALVPLITLMPFGLVGAIGSLAALDYLGFGLPPPTPSWGQLLQQAQNYRWAWWLILYPSLALFCVMLMGVFVGEGIRNAFDPRRYGRLH